MVFQDVMTRLCVSCTKTACSKTSGRTWTFVQGCYPWDCIHTTLEQRMHGDEQAKSEARDMCWTFQECPYTHVDNCKKCNLGCPKLDKNVKGEFCPHGVRGINIITPNNDDGGCSLAKRYVFNPQSDLDTHGVGQIVEEPPFSKDTKLKEKLGCDTFLCVRQFAKMYPPNRIRGIAGITGCDYKKIARRMSVYGYYEKDDTWQKRSIEEQNEWVAKFRYGEIYRRHLNVMRATTNKENPGTETTKEVE